MTIKRARTGHSNGLLNGTSSGAFSRDPALPQRSERIGGEVFNFRYGNSLSMPLDEFQFLRNYFYLQSY
jgi:hypothetical protein